MRMVISADSHVLEPPDLWTKAIGQKYGDALPQMVHELNGEKGNFFFTGLEYVRLESENRRLRAELEEKHQILGNRKRL